MASKRSKSMYPLVEKIKGTDLLMYRGTIKDRDGNVQSGSISTEWCGEKQTLDEEWLRNMHYFRIFNDDDIKISKKLINVRFIKHDRDIEDDGVEAYSIYLTKPINIGEFRVIARYPRYAINKNGDVLKISNGSIRRLKDTMSTYKKYKKHNKYPFIYLFDSRLHISTKVYLHLLLGLTWIPNNDWDKYILNHKDHDKMNVTIDNLEWTDNSGNTIKYYEHLKKINQ